MIKKTTLILIIFFMFTACGKKGDPEYQVLKKKPDLKNFYFKKV